MNTQNEHPDGMPAPAPASARRPVLGWLSWLARGSMAALLFVTLTGLAVTVAPFHPAVQWGVLLHTVVGALTLVPVAWYCARHVADFRNFTGDRTSQLPEDMGPGLAWGDYDDDGDDDLLLVSAGGALNIPTDQLQPCALFENLGQGRFRRVEAFPELRLRGLGAAWGDYDGDGFLDLALAGYDTLVLLHNDGGTGRFTRDSRLPDRKGFWSSPAWGDFDHDRRLDLHVCDYVQYVAHDADRGRISQQLGTAVPYTLNPSSYPGGRNALFQQRADGSFVDVAAELKVQNPEGRSLGGLWHDFDQDGWLDLYIANDVSDNVFFRNTGGRFEDISHPAWAADYRSAMGLAPGDFDRDGDDDLFISHWVAQENALYENLLVNRRARPAATNAPPGTNRPPAKTPPVRFVDIADQQGLGQIALPFVGWGTEFADLDHDGWLELLLVNGSTLEADGPPPRKLQPQEAFVFRNRRGQFFHNLAPLNPSLSAKHVSRGLACADYDNDGDLDFAIADLYEGARLYRNDMAAGHWLKARLRSKNVAGKPNGFGDGSTAVAWVNPEETGALLVLGEVALLRADHRLAEERLAAATHTNPKAVGGFFLRGYLAWQRGDTPAARQFLEQARTALGPDWQPRGATSEGDVKRKQHVETSPLSACWSAWNGRPEPATAYAALQQRLNTAR